MTTKKTEEDGELTKFLPPKHLQFGCVRWLVGWGETFVKKIFRENNFFPFWGVKLNCGLFSWRVRRMKKYLHHLFKILHRVEKYVLYRQCKSVYWKSWLAYFLRSFHFSDQKTPKSTFCRHNNFRIENSHTFLLSTYKLQHHRDINYRGSRYRPTCHMD